MFVDYHSIMDQVTHGEYPYLGSGSGRNVYEMGNGYVIKAARNSKGLAQNHTENDIFVKEHSNLLAPIEWISPDEEMLIMAQAKPYHKSINVIDYIYRYVDSTYFYFNELDYLVSKYHLIGADIRKSNSWGFIDHRLVLIDYGYTHEVRQRYY